MKTRIRSFVVLIVALSGLALAALGGVAALRQRAASRVMPQRLVELASRAGIALELGPSTWSPFGVVIGESRFALAGDESVRGEISRIDFDGVLTQPTHATLRSVQLRTRGESSHLFDVIGKLLGADAASFIRLERLDFDYEHQALGLVACKDVTLVSRSPEVVVHAGRVSLAGENFADVSFAIARRGDFLEVALGAASLHEAKVKLAQHVPRGGGTKWVFSIAYQPLSELLSRLGWWGGPELDGTAVVGSVTLWTEPDEPRSKGYLSLTFDRWPGPDWPEASAFLGRSAALYARIDADEPWHFDLPYVEITLPLFRLKGPGRLLPLGTGAHARFEVSGKEICRVLAARANTSSYRDVLVAYMEANPVAASVEREASPFAELRAQLDATRGLPSRANLAVELKGGCGLESRTTSSFRALSLPEFVPPPQASAVRGPAVRDSVKNRPSD